MLKREKIRGEGRLKDTASVHSIQIKDHGKDVEEEAGAIKALQDRNIVVPVFFFLFKKNCCSHSRSCAVKTICIYFECQVPLKKLNIYRGS